MKTIATITSQILRLATESAAQWFFTGLIGILTTILGAVKWIFQPGADFLSSLALNKFQIILICAAVFCSVFCLIEQARKRAVVRNENQDEKQKARERRKRERLGQKKLTKAGPFSTTFISETRRDPEFGRKSRANITLLLCSICVICLWTDRTFALSATIWLKKGYAAAETMLVVERDGRTVATGKTDKNGRCKFDQPVEPGPCRILAYRITDGMGDWSELSINLDFRHRKTGLEIGSFPDFRCKIKSTGTIHFSRSESVILPDGARIIGEFTTYYRGFSGLMVIQGRTCDRPFLPGSEIDNFILSVQRCQAVASCVHPHLPMSQILQAPLEDKYPLHAKPEAMAEQEAAREDERSVQIIPLLRTPAPEKIE